MTLHLPFTFLHMRAPRAWLDLLFVCQETLTSCRCFVYLPNLIPCCFTHPGPPSVFPSSLTLLVASLRPCCYTPPVLPPVLYSSSSLLVASLRPCCSTRSVPPAMCPPPLPSSSPSSSTLHSRLAFFRYTFLVCSLCSVLSSFCACSFFLFIYTRHSCLSGSINSVISPSSWFSSSFVPVSFHSRSCTRSSSHYSVFIFLYSLLPSPSHPLYCPSQFPILFPSKIRYSSLKTSMHLMLLLVASMRPVVFVYWLHHWTSLSVSLKVISGF